MIEHNEDPPQESLRGMLENAAAKPGPDLFTKTLQCCALAGIQLDPQNYARLLGMMMSRETSHAQVRAVLNMALPKGAQPIPLVPTDLSVEESRVAFQDAEVAQEDGDGEPEQEETAEGDESAPSAEVPPVLEFVGCEAIPELNGEYHALPPMPEVLKHNRPVYMKATDSGVDETDVYIYYWVDEPDKPWLTGWWFGFEVGGEDVLAYNAGSGLTPPRQRWQVLVDGQRRADPGTFYAPGEAEAAASTSAGRDPDEAERALSRLNLASLQGALTGRTPELAAYFGHFVVLLHLEHLAEVGVYRRRLLRHPVDRLLRMGYSLHGLRCFAIYGRRGSKKGLLPGWSDKGAEFVAFGAPAGLDPDHLRFRKGDSVILSRTDPLQDRIAEGTLVELDRRKIVVNLSGTMPEDARQSLWRLDAYANRTVYERQMTALLQLATMEKPDPVCEMLTAGKVGQLDAWAEKAVVAPWKQKAQALLSKHHRLAAESDKGAEKPAKSRSAALAQEIARGIDKTKMAQAEDEAGLIRDLNNSQKQAVQQALSRTCTIVQGPPGTGKTHVSVKVLQLWSQTMGLKPLLATSDSNVAVDNIAEGLHKLGVKAVRVGRAEKVRGHLEDITLEAIFQRKKEEKELERVAEEELLMPEEEEEEEAEPQPKAAEEDAESKKPATPEQEMQQEHAKKRKQRQEDFEARMDILRDMEVICATTMNAGGDFLSRFRFHGVLLDEVAQATEVSSIVPVVLRGAKQLVLVGDHCQLPPSVISREAELRGLSLSVYTRLVNVGVEPHFLDTQYRSHPRIAEFSARCFYGGSLRSGIPGSARPPPRGVPWPNPLVPVAFFEVSKAETLDGESKANPAEAQHVCDLVFEVLAQGELEFSDIGVVTPYMAQVRLLRRMFRDALPEDRHTKLLEIASVDNYQGREKDLIIFSAVRSNRRGNVGFLADWRRLNVMLTRARRGLVVFGSAKTLRHDPHWHQWLEWCHQHGATGRASVDWSRSHAESQGEYWGSPRPWVAQSAKAKAKVKAREKAKAKALQPRPKPAPPRQVVKAKAAPSGQAAAPPWVAKTSMKFAMPRPSPAQAKQADAAAKRKVFPRSTVKPQASPNVSAAKMLTNSIQKKGKYGEAQAGVAKSPRAVSAQKTASTPSSAPAPWRAVGGKAPVRRP